MRARSGWLEYDIEGDANGGGDERFPPVSRSASIFIRGRSISVVCSERGSGTASQYAHLRCPRAPTRRPLKASLTKAVRCHARQRIAVDLFASYSPVTTEQVD